MYVRSLDCECFLHLPVLLPAAVWELYTGQIAFKKLQYGESSARRFARSKLPNACTEFGLWYAVGLLWSLLHVVAQMCVTHDTLSELMRVVSCKIPRVASLNHSFTNVHNNLCMSGDMQLVFSLLMSRLSCPTLRCPAHADAFRPCRPVF
jgi:hypothetical protein